METENADSVFIGDEVLEMCRLAGTSMLRMWVGWVAKEEHEMK